MTCRRCMVLADHIPRGVLGGKHPWFSFALYFLMRDCFPIASKVAMVFKKQQEGLDVLIYLLKDQLKAKLMKCHVFKGWREGLIESAPTYKYYQNSQVCMTVIRR
ncbi:hypothetical protein Peur_031386 [Populus x canadensis]